MNGQYNIHSVHQIKDVFLVVLLHMANVSKTVHLCSQVRSRRARSATKPQVKTVRGTAGYFLGPCVLVSLHTCGMYQGFGLVLCFH